MRQSRTEQGNTLRHRARFVRPPEGCETALDRARAGLAERGPSPDIAARARKLASAMRWQLIVLVVLAIAQNSFHFFTVRPTVRTVADIAQTAAGCSAARIIILCCSHSSGCSPR